MKLYEIVDDDTTNDIISWLEPDFNKFIILSQESFCQYILPKYFRHGNFSSFIRMLNLYDFHKENKLTEGPVFYNKYFQKDQKILLHQITRKEKVKKLDEPVKDSGDHTKSMGCKKRVAKLISKSQSLDITAHLFDEKVINNSH